MKHHWSWLLTVCAVALGLGSLTLSSPSVTHGLAGTGAQARRTWTVCAQGCDFTSIQQAIDAADPAAQYGDRIEIKAGIYIENLVIRKNLYLEGAGPKQTVIKSLHPDRPILHVPGDTNVRVGLGNMAFVEAFSLTASSFCSGAEYYGRCPVGIEVGGQARLGLSKVRIEDCQGGGIWGHDRANVEIGHSEIRDPGWYGLLLEGSANFRVSSSTISVSYIELPEREPWGNRYVVLAREEARLNMGATNLSSSYRYQALKLSDRAQATLNLVSISENFRGIGLHDDARVTVTNSMITAHSMEGIYAQDRAQLDLRYSYVIVNSRAIDIRNEAQAFIEKTDFMLNQQVGVLVRDAAQVTLNDNRMARNILHGVALYVKDCYSSAPEQSRVRILGRGNEIPDRGQPDGNSFGALCPPDYPWPPGFRK